MNCFNESDFNLKLKQISRLRNRFLHRNHDHFSCRPFQNSTVGAAPSFSFKSADCGMQTSLTVLDMIRSQKLPSSRNLVDILNLLGFRASLTSQGDLQKLDKCWNEELFHVPNPLDLSQAHLLSVGTFGRKTAER